MKTLLIWLASLTVLTMAFSCHKEYSREGDLPVITTDTGTIWDTSFSQGTDSSYVDTNLAQTNT